MEKEEEKAAGGPPLTREPNWLPPVGSGLSACRAQALDSNTHWRWGGIQWGSTGRAIAAVKKRWEEKEAGEDEEKEKQKKSKRKERKKGWLSVMVGTGPVTGGQPTPGRVGSIPRPPTTATPFSFPFFFFLFLFLLPPLLLLPTVSSSQRRWHDRSGKASRTPSDATPAPVVAAAWGSGPASQRARCQARTNTRKLVWLLC